MPPKKRKVSSSPAGENVDSPSPTKKARSYTKRVFAATAASSRPKRAESAESVKETAKTPSTPLKSPNKKTGKVGRPRSKPATPASGLPDSTLQVIAKRGPGRPKKIVNGQTAGTSETPPVQLPVGPQDEPKKKRGRGRPKKESTLAKSTPAAKPEISSKTQVETEYHAADYDEEDLKDNRSYWLMKAEPEVRFVKGVDVCFSIDDLRNCSEPEPWDGMSLAGCFLQVFHCICIIISLTCLFRRTKPSW